MPLKIQQQYATQADALYNMAQGSEYFDDLAYSQSLAQGRGDEFILSVLGTEDLTTPDSFNDYYYNKLQGLKHPSAPHIIYLSTTMHLKLSGNNSSYLFLYRSNPPTLLHLHKQEDINCL